MYNLCQQYFFSINKGEKLKVNIYISEIQYTLSNIEKDYIKNIKMKQIIIDTIYWNFC